jgi:hypothetical protein
VRRAIAVALVSMLTLPAPISAQGTLRASIATEAQRAALSAGVAVPQAGTAAAWKAVIKVKRNTPVTLITAAGRHVIGSLNDADADHVVVGTRGNHTERFQRDEVSEIRTRQRRSILKNAARGALLGFGVGAALGAVFCADADSCSRDDLGTAMAVSGVSVVPTGSAIGLVAGVVDQARAGRVIYRAPAP